VGCIAFCDEWPDATELQQCMDNVLAPFVGWFAGSNYDAAFWFVTYDTPPSWQCTLLYAPGPSGLTLTEVGEAWNRW